MKYLYVDTCSCTYLLLELCILIDLYKIKSYLTPCCVSHHACNKPRVQNHMPCRARQKHRSHARIFLSCPFATM
jgi:hypothetical protein